MRFKLFKNLANFFKSSCKILKIMFISVAKGILYIFSNILLGIKYLFISIFSVLKYILIYIYKFFVNVFKGIKYIVVGIYKLLYYLIKNFILGCKYFFVGFARIIVLFFKYLVLGFKYLGVFLYKIFKYFGMFLYKIFKYIGLYLYKGLYFFFKHVVKGIIYLFISIYKVIKFIFINVYKGFKYIFIYIYKAIYFFFKHVLLSFKYMFLGIFGLIKYIFVSFWIGLKTIGLGIRKLFVNLGKIIVKFLKGFKGTWIKIGKFLIKAFILTPGNIIKKIYIAYSDRADKNKKKKEELNKKKQKYLIEKIAKADRINKEKRETLLQRKEKALLISKAKEDSRRLKRSERKSFSVKLKLWYAGLSFVKDIRNRREMKRQTLLIDFEGEDAVRSEEKIIYKYVAKNLTTGKIEKGIFAAFSKLDVHSYLLSESFEIYEITPIKRSGKSLFTAKITKADLVFLLTQLSTFLKSGITLIAAVKILEKQTKKTGYKQIYKSVIYELTMGENFSEALAKQGASFPRLLINMIKTAELTGNLPETLDDMAEYYNETEKTRKQMISAMTYPIVILIFASTIIVFILIFVIPQFVDIYADIDAELPAITSAVINISTFLQHNIVYILIGLVIGVILYRVLYASIKVFKTLNQWIFMHLPVIGKIMIYNEVTMFTKTFGSLLNHNVFITDSMEVLSKVTNNEIYKMLIFDTITNLAKGEVISNSFKDHWAFPIIAYEMLLTGEKTGQLGDMMTKVSNYYQEQHKVAVNQIKVFIEPVMIVFLAVVVGTILLSVILPMFSMYSSVM